MIIFAICLCVHISDVHCGDKLAIELFIYAIYVYTFMMCQRICCFSYCSQILCLLAFESAPLKDNALHVT